MRASLRALGLAALGTLSSISCAHRAIDLTTPIQNVRADVERSEGEFIYTLHLPNAAGGETWRVEAEDGLDPAVTNQAPESLVRWRVPTRAYRERPYHFVLHSGGQAFPLKVEAVHADLWKPGQRTVYFLGGLLTGRLVWPN